MELVTFYTHSAKSPLTAGSCTNTSLSHYGNRQTDPQTQPGLTHDNLSSHMSKLKAVGYKEDEGYTVEKADLTGHSRSR